MGKSSAISCGQTANRSGRAEAAIALRQRLNETVEEVDALRKAHTELEVKFETQSKELTIAKSDRESAVFAESTFVDND